MTEHTMNTVIHAAFRRDLIRFGDALDGFTEGDQGRADELGRAWDNYASQLHHHHEDEETLFWPVLSELGADPALVGDLDGEHERMSAALDHATSVITTFREAPTAEHTDAARDAIAELSDVLLNHLAHEERDLEPLATLHHDAPPMKAAQKAVRKAHKGNTGTFIAWLLDGADADVTACLRGEIPPPVLTVIERIGGRRYRRDIAPVWATPDR